MRSGDPPSPRLRRTSCGVRNLGKAKEDGAFAIWDFELRIGEGGRGRFTRRRGGKITLPAVMALFTASKGSIYVAPLELWIFWSWLLQIGRSAGAGEGQQVVGSSVGATYL